MNRTSPVIFIGAAEPGGCTLISAPGGRATIPLMAVVTQEYVNIPVGDLAMRTFVAAPRSPGPHPAIVFYSDIFQLTEPTLRWCVRLASYGFLVAAPEIYHRIEPSGTVLAFDDEGKARGQRDAETTPVAHFDAAAAALDWLEERTGGAPLGAAGHCTYPTGLHDRVTSC
jgi:carboxymethylenebutenolidase